MLVRPAPHFSRTGIAREGQPGTAVAQPTGALPHQLEQHPISSKSKKQPSACLVQGRAPPLPLRRLAEARFLLAPRSPQLLPVPPAGRLVSGRRRRRHRLLQVAVGLEGSGPSPLPHLDRRFPSGRRQHLRRRRRRRLLLVVSGGPPVPLQEGLEGARSQPRRPCSAGAGASARLQRPLLPPQRPRPSALDSAGLRLPP